MDKNLDEKFCPTCGRPFVTKRNGPGETTKKCFHCGHVCNRYDNYCRYCGGQLRIEACGGNHDA